jgi:tetratricopeptide (TPR) repeat protein
MASAAAATSDQPKQPALGSSGPGPARVRRRAEDLGQSASKRVGPPRKRVSSADERSVPSAEELLSRAMRAKTPRSRGIWARRGLALKSALDRTTHSMLLRQLYLAHYEQRHFADALEAALQSLELNVLPDVAHQDAARAHQALGDIDEAAGHLRLAARVSPPNRRPFHWWTLGSLFFLAGRYDEAIGAMSRASRWGTTDKPLYQGHLAVVQCASGKQVPDLGILIERLAEVPAGQGYGRFVLGQMAYYGRRFDEARRYLEAFVRRTSTGRRVLAIALDGELAVAKQTLANLES